MIPLILVGIWVVVLVPIAAKHYLMNRPGRSIASFHRELDVLGMGPKAVEPAYTLGSENLEEPGGRPKLRLVTPEDAAAAEADAAEALALEYEAQRRAAAAKHRREQHEQARERRRDIFIGLVGTFLFTGLFGLIPSLRGMWVMAGISGVLLAGFVGLAVYGASMESESRHLAQMRVPETAVGYRELATAVGETRPMRTPTVRVRYEEPAGFEEPLDYDDIHVTGSYAAAR